MKFFSGKRKCILVTLGFIILISTKVKQLRISRSSIPDETITNDFDSKVQLEPLHEDVPKDSVFTDVQCNGSACQSKEIQVLPVPGAELSIAVEKLIEQCMAATHLTSVLDSESVIAQAKNNAIYFFEEFRKVIPQESLSEYKSHCWKTSYSMQWTHIHTSHYNGIIGNITFSKHFDPKSSRRLILPILDKIFLKKRYDSDLVCLPTVFIAGFPKCGSSFLYSFTNKLVSRSLYNRTEIKMNAEKEPHFWVHANAVKVKSIPTVDSIGGYLLNFLPGLRQISEFRRSNGLLIDGTPNNIFNWPRFRETEHNLTNYCLIPAVLPVLLPSSKFIVIMRNPVEMLYSAFWFSCTTIGVKFTNNLLLKCPDLFHYRIMFKIKKFNNCMRDNSVSSISYACELHSNQSYNSCIRERLHLLDKCTHEITFNLFTPELLSCGRSRIAMGLYFVHIRKWLSVVQRDRFLFLTLEEVMQDPSEVAHDMLKFLGLKTDVAADLNAVNRIVNSCHENTQTTVNYKHDPRLLMRNDTELMLKRFFYPFNSLLAGLLNADKFLWGG